ncbi:Tad domain-containing protein [Emcibacter sp. SYSU 3D8]|uniref:TadE/TadG family type IV pilus assembly protein n=1 Tax=Emcibacter sp. SYSU 3D8 TaxID=3133969 RepID=UPI0031FF2CD4
MKLYRAYVRCRKASVATVFALVLPVLLGFTALVAEYGSVLVTEAHNQRVSDLASYAGAVAYNSVSSGKEAAATAAAQRITAMNGVPSDKVTVTFPTSVKTPGAVSVQAQVTTEYPLLIARVLNASTKVPVTTDAFTEISGGAASCILALDAGGTGVTMTGAGAINASTCAVNSNNKVAAPCGTSITAAAVSWNTSYSYCTSTPNVTASTIVQSVTTDPFIGNAGVAAMYARVATVDGMSLPSPPNSGLSGSALTLAYAGAPWPESTYTATVGGGCTATSPNYSGNWTITCPSGGGTYTFGNFNMSSKTLDFAVGGDPNNTYNFVGTASFSGIVNMGPGKYNFEKGLTGTGGSTVVFDSGTFKMGRNTSNCNGSGQYSICATGTTMTFRGPSTFELGSGISVPGGYTLRLGYDAANANLTGNSYSLGASSTGHAINVGGGGKLYMADATDSGKVFQANGNFNGGGGGSCTLLPAAGHHDIDGYMLMTGAVVLGSGVYTIDGYMALGASGGGGGTCNGETISVKGVDVNIMISGSSTPGSGNCSGKAFCVGAGYSDIILRAPTTGALANLAIIGPQNSSYTGGGLFSEGAMGGQVSGAFYFPYGPMTMTGGAGVADAGACLQVVATNVSITAGTTLASSCVGGSGTVTAKLVR